MKKDVRILSNGGDINEYGHISKEKFLNEISAKFLGIIPRTKYWQMRLIRKYRGTLEISKKRNPYYAVEGFDGTEKWIKISAHGDDFKLLVAFREWLTLWKGVLILIITVFGSPYLLIFRNWFIKITTPYFPLW
ncbi:hypothetical protein A2643_00630 [Candidatus Nomurabacteria bacterium RIFCSPHIGHO2_01_FULL_39_220]|uniref:Uncharacterized protein n=1 Tax=Candidatus Nomurabacteria bacterium RIFCSPLOWO2_02_FULL_40_67 TaxID=1801787 RepID=A0A1F6Y452_9BACT|nr:MAG: hypothetical protein A2W12_01765 [Candidatus Nomurabacteria bacterium RBG_16_40_11]OGI70278.1 MAG: hypothetical protein A2643_00630 [Candidatus Nomurabacteria bacterium RIFCSPHIGHO2_01_FULL_39_220]OGI73481.1 MAG: hypothetical protein A2W56_02230 [Candidatus Nomurabacteria bacterium RIFCSPHIGHO2_02_41_18]OGI78750.1 MAG: hypothetical protein A3C65_02160 [Candidatus Nomurabacteria bacterium RIFCSPHIGHO2_02_FULL_41_150]OGI80827.1 MAG: hypothetical protein A3E03_03775 [Candidatus Nomurabacte